MSDQILDIRCDNKKTSSSQYYQNIMKSKPEEHSIPEIIINLSGWILQD